ncbi:MAG: class I SAM-dependent methyltransferase [Bacillota bacterium]
MEFTGERLVPHLEHAAELFFKHMSRYLLAQSLFKGKKVLDAGCGAGYGSAFLAVNGAKAVVGIDLSPEAINYAKINFQAANLTFQVGDCCDLKFPRNSFDAVVALEIIEHLNQYLQFLAEVKRALKPGGLLLVSTN